MSTRKILKVHMFGCSIQFLVKLQSVTKIMGKTAIGAISCFYPLPPLSNVEKQQAKLASSHVMGSQHCIGGKGDF